MSERRLLLVSQGLAAIAVVSAMLGDLGIDDYLGLSVRTTGIVALAAASAAFFVARKRGSLFVSASLLTMGIMNTALALQAAIFYHSLGALVFGVSFGAWVLFLGVAKTAATARTDVRSKAPSPMLQGMPRKEWESVLLPAVHPHYDRSDVALNHSCDKE